MKKMQDAIDLKKIIRGTLIQRFVKCSDKKCKCQSGKKIHGPNWYVVYTEQKKTHHVYISKENLEIVKEYIENYNILWKKITERSIKNLKVIKKSEEKNER